MRFLFGDCHTPHPAGQFCTRLITERWFLSFFETPFQYEREGALHTGAPGDMLIQPPGSVIYHGWAEGGFVNTWVYMSGEELTPLLERYPLPFNSAFPMGRADPLERYVGLATEEFAVDTVGTADMLHSLTTRLVVELYRGYHRIGGAAGRLERLREDLLHMPEKPWSLATMAARCGYSVSRFCALYRERFGVSPKQDLLTARLTLARNMLCYTDRPITAIADTCGFDSAPYFSKYFKAATGLSPREYRRRQQKAPHP